MSAIAGIRILIVDDSEENLVAMETLLEGPDRIITKARSGNEALGILLEQEAALILLDAQISGMNGFETGELIRGSSRTSNIPIIFLIAAGKENNPAFLDHESGLVDYISKPIEPEILKSRVRMLIEFHQQKQTLETITRKLEKTISELIESKKKLLVKEESLRDAWKASEKARDIAIEANRVKNEFLANLSHEIRTPLNGIIGLADLALLEKCTPQQKVHIESIKQSGESLIEILDEVIDISKIEAERVELESIPFNPIEIIERVARMLSIKIYEKNIELICRIDPVIPDQVMGDPTRFRQIILNLLSNAYKFTEQGEINIEADIVGGDEQKIIFQFVISDTGVGIPQNILNHLFQTYDQAEVSASRQYGATGLGLGITRKLLALMHGDIRVESNPENGTRFVFRIPFIRCYESVMSQKERCKSIGHFSPVLIIEKTTAGARSVKTVFDSLPIVYEIWVRPVVDLDELINTIKDQHLIIIDSQVVTTDGKFLSDELPKALNHLENLPVIVMAPSTMNLNRDDLLVRGLFSILRKPLFPRDVKAILTEQFKQIRINPTPYPANISEVPEVRTLNILLAEDNPINTRLAVGFIRRKNWEVDCAANGAEAVEKFRTKSYDLILMDIQMPVMDGMEATRKIREIEARSGLRPIPVVALSAHAMKEDIDRAMSCGMDNYITKPFKPTELYLLIEKLARRNDENQEL